MTNLETWLSGCDKALAEADLLIATLSDFPGALEPELTATRLRISELRREVDRLRGMPAVPQRRKIAPNRIDLSNIDSPWAADRSDLASKI